MTKKLAVFVVATLAWAAALAGQSTELPGQTAASSGPIIKYGGYFSLDYLKGQADSGFANGSLENIQAGLMVNGLISQRFAFALEVRSRSESLFEIEQAWAGFVPSQAFSARVGMYLVPFGQWNRASRPYETPLISTPLNLAFLYPASWRDLGVTVEGQVAIFSYATYVGNGLKEADNLASGQQFSDNNKDKAKGGRLGLIIGQDIQAGASYYTGKYDTANERNLSLEGVDFSWVTAQWEIKAEVAKALIDNPDPIAEGKSEGYSVWMVLKFAHLQPWGSLQRVKYMDPGHPTGDEMGIAINQRRWAIGLTWTPANNLFLKIEYDWNKDKILPAARKNLFSAQAAFSF